MRKIRRIIKLLVILSIFLALFAFPVIYWYLLPSKSLNILILDKTVPKKDYREHLGLVWTLNNLKYLSGKNKPFEFDKDYYGFFPLDKKNYDVVELPDPIDKNVDLIYMADTYGAYTEDFYAENLRGNKSELIYGGTQLNEILSIKNSLKKGSLFITEFNSLATPTPDDARKEMEDILGVEWSGWIGRYFKNLSRKNTEIPLWMIKNYEKQYKKKWKFSSEGFAFVNVNGTEIILTAKEIETDDLLRINFKKSALKEFDVKDKTRYYYWFDITKSTNRTEELATFKLHVNNRGKEILNKFGVATEFPAITRTRTPYKTYYFAGDFADSDDVPLLWNMAFQKQVNSFLVADAKGEQEHFFWYIYYPVLDKILDNEINAR